MHKASSVKGVQVSSNEDPINSHEVKYVLFSSHNQRYDIIICVYWFELFSQVSDVAHGPFGFFLPQLYSYGITYIKNKMHW